MKPILIAFLLTSICFASKVLALGPQCPLTVATADLSKDGSKTQVVNVFGFKKKPTLNSQALVLPYPQGRSMKLKITKASVGAEEGMKMVEVQLEDASATSLKEIKPTAGRSEESPSSVAVLWPLPSDQPKMVPVNGKDLPAKVAPSIVKASIDLDGNGSTDALLVEFCCETRKPAEAVISSAANNVKK
jgi:hypothetical protein